MEKVKILFTKRSKNIYVLQLDNEEILNVDQEVYFKNYVYEKEDLSYEEIDKLRFQSEKEACHKRALAYLLNGKRTANRMRSYLFDKGFSERAVNATIEKLVEYRKIDDEEFIKSFLKNRIKDHSKNKLISKLIYHGIDTNMAIEAVEKALSEYEEDNY